MESSIPAAVYRDIPAPSAFVSMSATKSISTTARTTISASPSAQPFVSDLRCVARRGTPRCPPFAFRTGGRRVLGSPPPASRQPVFQANHINLVYRGRFPHLDLQRLGVHCRLPAPRTPAELPQRQACRLVQRLRDHLRRVFATFRVPQFHDAFACRCHLRIIHDIRFLFAMSCEELRVSSTESTVCIPGSFLANICPRRGLALPLK